MLRKKILIMCTGNSCRSQMAEGFARDAGWLAFSAGTKPEIEVNPFAVKVMAEVEVDISRHKPESAEKYLMENFDLIATVCDDARDSCPVFSGNCETLTHHSFIDPAIATGDNENKLKIFRKVRDEIREWINDLSINTRSKV